MTLINFENNKVRFKSCIRYFVRNKLVIRKLSVFKTAFLKVKNFIRLYEALLQLIH